MNKTYWEINSCHFIFHFENGCFKNEKGNLFFQTPFIKNFFFSLIWIYTYPEIEKKFLEFWFKKEELPLLNKICLSIVYSGLCEIELKKEYIYNYYLSYLDNTEKIQLYIHNPFCKTICKFCDYKGILYSEKKYNIYYNEYFPQVLDYYKPFFLKRQVDLIYFWWWTPDLMSDDFLIYLSKNIPWFSNIKSKIIDIHPAICNINRIKLLWDLWFTLLNIWVQTFDNTILDWQNRLRTSIWKISQIIKIAKKCNMYTSIDIIAYLDTYWKKDLMSFYKDLKIASKLQPTFITSMINFLLKSDIELTRKYVWILSKFLNDTPKYYLDRPLSSIFSIKGQHLISKEYLIDNFKKDIFNYVPYDNYNFDTHKTMTIWLWEYNNNFKTTSLIGNLYYYEKNVDGETKFFLRKKWTASMIHSAKL